MADGLYVTVEGIDGSGTTSVVERLVGRCEVRRMVTEPSESWLGRVTRESFEERDVPELSRFYLFMADRAGLAHHIRGLVGDGADVISDRGPDSTRAYQYHTASLSEWFIDANILVAAEQPDLTIWLDVDLSIAAERMEGADAFEDIALQEKVNERYRTLERNIGRIERVDANQPLDDVVEDAEEIIRNHER